MNSRARSRALSFGSFTKSSSGETRESGSTPLVKQSSEELSPIPESTEVEQPSDSVPEQIEFLVGEDTEQLSDVTDPDVYLTKSSAAKSRGSSSGRLFIWFAISGITNRQRLPCIFTYNAWSSCSATCWDGSSNYPQMHRYVNKNSIVQARGGDKPDCPNDLINRIDFAPCNTFRCPTNLSHYPFTRCYYKDSLKESSGGCYRIRDVPLDDRLILMDTNLTQDCSKMECDRIERFLF
ncbi:Kinesin-like protein [Dirofilaria immitis]